MVEVTAVAKGALATLRVAKGLGPLLKAYFGHDSDALAELMRKGDAAWVTEVCELLREKVDVLEDRLHEVHPLVTSLRWEAARDATAGRRRMLAHLAANMLNSGARVEDKARVERAVRDLDPDDIALLAMIRSLEGGAFSVWNGHERRANLASCVDVDYLPLAGAGGVGKPAVSVSGTGHLILNALSEFLFEELLAGFERQDSVLNVDEAIANGSLVAPFWMARRAAYPIRVISTEFKRVITGELFAWDSDQGAYVLRAGTAHSTEWTNDWIVLQPKAGVIFRRQDNSTHGRPLIACDPLAPPTKAELDFVYLRER